MNIDEIISFVNNHDGVLTLRPGPGANFPELSWGDSFFYYSPNGTIPTRTQPFATIVTKNYPDDELSRLDRSNTFRVNISAGKDAFVRLTGHPPRESANQGYDPSTLDMVFPHPVYGTAGWLAVVNPGARTAKTVRELLSESYRLARARYIRNPNSRAL
ncbi:MAG: hypothetical protein HOQ05_11470 [Corynebacteriales bacterium]|nr:hypothetical protein [Mycobacteriales bacterium]